MNKEGKIYYNGLTIKEIRAERWKLINQLNEISDHLSELESLENVWFFETNDCFEEKNKIKI